MNPSEIDRRPCQVALRWLIANAFGAAVFLAIASISWVEPELADEPGASSGSAFVWILTAAPIFLLFAMLNVGVLTWASVIRSRQGQWPISKLFWLCFPLWLCALVADGLHHGV